MRPTVETANVKRNRGTYTSTKAYLLIFDVATIVNIFGDTDLSSKERKRGREMRKANNKFTYFQCPFLFTNLNQTFAKKPFKMNI